jgi:hypothetical protein
MKPNKSTIAYELFCRFDGLINSVEGISATLPTGMPIRFKPLFTSYNSCIDSFRTAFPKEYESLNLEPLPLYDDAGHELFLNTKISTLLHQAEAVLSLLKGISPYQFAAKPTSVRESLSWYWHNTHPGLIYYLLMLLASAFIAGTIFSETKVYKNTVKPFVIEYTSFKKNPQISNTVSEPPIKNKTQQ